MAVTSTDQKPSNPAAVVGLIAALAAFPALVFVVDIVAWALALVGLFASIAGVRRANAGASGMIAAVVGLAVAAFVVLFLAVMLALFLTRPLRY